MTRRIHMTLRECITDKNLSLKRILFCFVAAIILLDEPTTGLDSFTAHSLIKTLSNLVKTRNKIVLLTIHQPRSDIFTLFDRIGILSQGEMVYFGEREKLVAHFTDAGFPCPTYVNPLDHYGTQRLNMRKTFKACTLNTTYVCISAFELSNVLV